jgi:hypothetical protein
MPDTTRRKAHYNRRTYDTVVVRIRRDSALADRVAAHKLDGQSLNSLVVMLLAQHFGITIPLAWYDTRKVMRIFPEGDEGHGQVQDPSGNSDILHGMHKGI